MQLRPFFYFLGAKWRMVNASLYPPPKYETIVEPFAGAAGYSVNYADHNVILYDLDPVVASLWDYLIHVSSAEILRLPALITDLREMHMQQEAKSLIGFWVNKGVSSPCNIPGAWMRGGLRPNSFWGEAIRHRISTQVDHIRHWKIVNASYEKSDYGLCTYFVDPPYENANAKWYKFHDIDYARLGIWCKTLYGQVIVCERQGASWLPFQFVANALSTQGKYRDGHSKEAVWINNTEERN